MATSQMKFLKLNVNIAIVLLNMKVIRVIQENINAHLAIKIIQTKLMKIKKEIQEHIKFSNKDINKFIFLLRKGTYPYECMDDWEKFNETTLPEKE